MTDRELLELAAKAAGYPERATWPSKSCPCRDVQSIECIEHRCKWENDNGLIPAHLITRTRVPRYWNPLTDDGDALRLAVKLATENAMQLVWQGGMISYRRACAAPLWNGEAGKPDPYSATRRAIVRVAAEIGKAA